MQRGRSSRAAAPIMHAACSMQDAECMCRRLVSMHGLLRLLRLLIRAQLIR
jgi:hypothetical protein